MPAIQSYQQGFVLCDKYFEAVGRQLPMKCDFGEVEQLEAHIMWL